jgi:hypothetical protein
MSFPRGFASLKLTRVAITPFLIEMTSKGKIETRASSIGLTWDG